MTTQNKFDYINLTADGSVRARSVLSRDEYSEAAFDNWQQGRYENLSMHYATIRSF
jgi:hypothetical protein